MNYLLNIAIWIDQGCNTMLFGSPDETLSARAFRTERDGKIFGKLFRPLIDALFYIVQQDHCRKAYIAERQRKQLPKDYQ